MPSGTTLRALFVAQCERADALCVYLDDLSRIQFSSHVPSHIAAELLKVARALRTSLLALEHDPDYLRLDADTAADQVATYNASFSLLAQVGEIVRSCNTGAGLPHWERPLQRVTGYPRGEAVILIYPGQFFNYSTGNVGGALSNLCANAGLEPDSVGLDSTVKQIYVIGFPGPQVQSSLQHCLLFHEIGHVYWFDRPELALSMDRVAWSPQEARAQFAGDYQAATEAQKLRRWIKEVACDAIGFRLGGEAFIAAACEFFAGSGLALGSDSHPPSILRLHLLFRALSGKEGTDEFGRYLAEWRTDIDSRFAAGPRDPVVARIDGEFGTILSNVDAVLPADSVHSAGSDLESLVERLRIGVPPDSHRFGVRAEPATLAETLTAGWRYYISQLATTSDGEKARQVRRSTEVLTSKAIELAEAARRWGEVP